MKQVTVDFPISYELPASHALVERGYAWLRSARSVVWDPKIWKQIKQFLLL